VTALVPLEQIQRRIYIIRKEKVLLDSDLADLYEVSTRALIQAVKRNQNRFPSDFMFQLSNQEFKTLRSQNVTSKRGGRRVPPYAFTEQGIAMLSSVLRSETAVEVNIQIMRAFVFLRRMAEREASLARKMRELENRMDEHALALAQISVLLDELQAPKAIPKKRRIGFGRE